MKNFFNFFFSAESKDYSDNTGYLFKRLSRWLVFITLLIFLMILICLKCNKLAGTITFLTVAGASLAIGAATGFLFGLPRSEKYRYSKKEDADHNSKDYSYGDNTNLEEVSDWVTKIIVGITLIKFRTIISWLDMSAHSIENTFKAGCDESLQLNTYVFGYGVMILYFLTGGGMCYLWARTNLSLILTRSKKMQEEIEKQQLIAKIQELANPDMNNSADNVAANKAEAMKLSTFSTADFKRIIENVYNTKSIKREDDLQWGRWGEKNQVGDKVFDAIYDGSNSSGGLFRINLRVRSINLDNPLKGQVAFFLHDTFPSEIVYAVAENNLAEFTINACEAFAVGARLEDNTELELNLNKVKGFPDKFYYKE